MPANLHGEYGFIVRVYGDEAQKDALRIRNELEVALGMAELSLARRVDHVNQAISSQTRRLSYNIRRLGEAEQAAESLTLAWGELLTRLSGEGDDAFESLIAAGQRAYDELVGHSTLVDLLIEASAIFNQLNTMGIKAFEGMGEAAEAEAQQIIDVMSQLASGKAQWPTGTQIEGVSVGGKWASLENLKKYADGMIQLNDVMTGKPMPQEMLDQLSGSAGRQSKKVEEATDAWGNFTDQINKATLRFFGLRRLGYGLEQFGGQLAAAGEKNVQALASWVDMYGDFNHEATRAAAAMEMTREEQEMLEASVLSNVEAMKLFRPEETVDGLRAWAAGTGAVVHTQSELNEILEQTYNVQVLAALGGSELESTMRNVGGTIAEYGLSLEDLEQVTALYNFTAAKTFAEVEDVGDAFRMVGPLAESLNITLEESAAALGMLSDENIKGTMAGRAFRQMLIQLTKPSKDHNEAMNMALGLTGQLGDSWQEIVFPEGKFIGLAQYIDLLAAATENATDQQKNNLLATIATANELPALVALVDAQIDARKEGINVMRSWNKWSQGIVDDEVAAFADYMERVRGIEIDTATDMYSLWDQQSTTFLESEHAKLMEYENRWHSIQMRLGRIVFEKAAPAIDKMLELVEKITDFAAEYPQLVAGAMTAAGIQLVLGNLIRTTGQLIGVAANIMILYSAYKGFSGSVGIFSLAVQQFAGAVGLQSVTDKAGPAAWIARLLPWLVRGGTAVGAAHLAFSGEAEMQQRMRDLFDQLSNTFTQAEQIYLQQLAAEGFARRETMDWMGGIQEIRFGDVPTDWAVILQDMLNQGVISMERYAELSEELATQCSRAAQSADQIAQSLDATFGRGFGDDLFPSITGGVGALTDEQMQAVDLYDEMMSRLADITADYAERRQEMIRAYQERELDYHEAYLDRRADIVEDYHDKEAGYWRKHLDRLEDIQERYQDSLANEIEKFNESLEDIWKKAAEREAEVKEDIQQDIQDSREDHLKELRRMEEDHRDKLIDLAIRRDAYGIYQEMRDYRKKRSRAVEDQKDREQELKEDGQRRIEEIRRQASEEEQELRESHAKKLADLEEALAEQLAEEKENYKESKLERAKAHKERLKELDEQYAKERKKRQEAHRDELDDLKAKFDEEFVETQTSMTEELAMLLGYYSEGLTDYAAYLQGRLDLLERYLEDNRRMWEDEPEYPDSPPPGDAPGGPYPAFSVMPGLFEGPVQSREVVVRGDFSMALSADQNMQGVVSPAMAEAQMQVVFDHVYRQLEVSFG